MSKHISCLIAILMLGLATFTPVHAQSSSRDKRMIAYAKNLRVSKLDSALPKQRLGYWLQSLVGAKTAINWEINDCGEQTGVRGDGSGINPPLCAEAQAKLSDRRRVIVSILVGSHKAGIKGKPEVRHIFVENNGEFTSPGTLHELQELIK